MGHVRLEAIAKDYGSRRVIEHIDLDVRDGEFMVFVGPSGCGKTTTLRMIAGLEAISSGTLSIDGARANDVHPARRGAAMVFQSYALYPHMTVAENMGFSLRMAGVPRAQRRARVVRAAEILRIDHQLDRFPRQLSGGERQRVAIGRAIVRKPKVFLFDEPLSNLDAALRVDMRIELARLHRELGTTMIYVTHDQTEAMTLGQRIAVFNRGRIEQVGAPMELFERPASMFVAGFLGSPSMNMLDAPGPDASAQHRALWAALHPADAARSVGVRPEHVALGALPSACVARVELVEHLGETSVVHLRIDGVPQPWRVLLRSGAAVAPEAGDACALQVDASRVHGFDADGLRLADSTVH